MQKERKGKERKKGKRKIREKKKRNEPRSRILKNEEFRRSRLFSLPTIFVKFDKQFSRPKYFSSLFNFIKKPYTTISTIVENAVYSPFSSSPAQISSKFMAGKQLSADGLEKKGEGQ